MKQSMPGGQAIRTSSAQNHEKQGRSTVGVRLHHRTPPPAGRRQVLGQVRLRQPFGHQQPAVVGDDPDFLPARLQQRLDPLHQARQISSGMRRARPIPSSWPVLSRLPNSVQARPVGIARLVGCRGTESRRRPAACGSGRCVRSLPSGATAGAELFPGGRARDLAGHGRNGGLGGRRDGRQGDGLMAQLDLADPCRSSSALSFWPTSKRSPSANRTQVPAGTRSAADFPARQRLSLDPLLELLGGVAEPGLVDVGDAGSTASRSWWVRDSRQGVQHGERRPSSRRRCRP